MFAKTKNAIIGSLMLTSVSFALTTSAYSAPREAPSQTKDRHNPTDTKGKPAAPPPVILPRDGVILPGDGRT
jgi:hypothetical protein